MNEFSVDNMDWILVDKGGDIMEDERDSDDDGIQAPGNPSRLSASISDPDEISLAKAASSIDDAQLLSFLADLRRASPESQPSYQMMQLVDYFRKSFTAPNSWPEMFEECHINIILDIPLCHVSESVYEVCASFIADFVPIDLSDFVLRCLDDILADLAYQNSVQQFPSKAQDAVFVVLALVLREKPRVLLPLFQTSRDPLKYQDIFPAIVWMIGQVSLRDPAVGLYLWVDFLLPLACSTPRPMDRVLQLVERILLPQAQIILEHGSFVTSELLVPPSALDMLMRTAYPAPSSWSKDTKRFVRVYHGIKEVALAIWQRKAAKTKKLLSEQLCPYAIRAMQEKNNRNLYEESFNLYLWCVTQNNECCSHWVKLHPVAKKYVLWKVDCEYEKSAANITTLYAAINRINNSRVMNESVEIREEHEFPKQGILEMIDPSKLKWKQIVLILVYFPMLTSYMQMIISLLLKKWYGA